MDYKYMHKKSFKGFVYTLILLFVILIAYIALQHFEIFGLNRKNTAYEISIALLSILFVIALVDTLRLSYRIRGNCVSLKILFLDTFRGQLKISSIYKLVWSKREDRLICCYTNAANEQCIAFMNIAREMYDNFALEIKKVNQAVVYDVVE